MEPILLLHGALGAQDQFDALAARLSETCTVHRLNFSGHGPDNVVPEAFLPDIFVKDVLQYLDKNSLSTVKIFGYSMGGYIALMLALRHPERITALLTLGTKMDWNPEAAAREAAMLNPDKILEKVPAFAKTLQQRHGESRWRTVLEKTAGMMQYLGQHRPLDEATLRTIAIPVTVALADADEMVRREEAMQAAEWIPGARFEVLEGGRHAIERCPVEGVAAMVENHLFY
ncbi:MAG: alpha/beta fold hydrolase [Saprospiraceae bacterium]|nr:alpha/beta fold hydrolase [Saprospiraceae bacterium]